MRQFPSKRKYPATWPLFRSDGRRLLMIFAIIVGIIMEKIQFTSSNNPLIAGPNHTVSV